MATQKSAGGAATEPKPQAVDAPTRPVQQDAIATQVKEALAVLFAIRLVNALCVRTFFQPDEYFQALEPAWELVFGSDSGAWMTWVSVWPKSCPTKSPKLTRPPGMGAQDPLVNTSRHFRPRLHHRGQLLVHNRSACSLSSLCSVSGAQGYTGRYCCLERLVCLEAF